MLLVYGLRSTLTEKLSNFARTGGKCCDDGTQFGPTRCEYPAPVRIHRCGSRYKVDFSAPNVMTILAPTHVGGVADEVDPILYLVVVFSSFGLLTLFNGMVVVGWVSGGMVIVSTVAWPIGSAHRGEQHAHVGVAAGIDRSGSSCQPAQIHLDAVVSMKDCLNCLDQLRSPVHGKEI